MKLRKRLSIVAGLTVACTAIAITAGAVTRGGAGAAIAPPPSSSCQLGNGIKHVIEITFDNVHFNRDNPNVLSDLEQMPALENFITSQGTMLSNNHTPLIAHTADDSITNYTGLYGDRHGQPHHELVRDVQHLGRPGVEVVVRLLDRDVRARRVPEPAVLAARSCGGPAAEDAAGAVGAVHACGLRRR